MKIDRRIDFVHECRRNNSVNLIFISVKNGQKKYIYVVLFWTVHLKLEAL